MLNKLNKFGNDVPVFLTVPGIVSPFVSRDLVKLQAREGDPKRAGCRAREFWREEDYDFIKIVKLLHSLTSLVLALVRAISIVYAPSQCSVRTRGELGKHFGIITPPMHLALSL